MTWKRLLRELARRGAAGALEALDKIDAYATSVKCRHASLIEHFGQEWPGGSCNACDVCLGKLEVVDDALMIGQKILSCVLRVARAVWGRLRFARAHRFDATSGSCRPATIS